MDFPKFPIGPIIEYYDGEPVEADRGWHPIRCPFHDDGDASASLRTEGEQVFNCHACGIGGNAVQVLMKREGLMFKDAVGRAEEITGVRSSAVRGQRGGSYSLSGQAGNWEGYSKYKSTWLRGESDDS